MPHYARQGMIAGLLAYAVDAAGSLSFLITLMYLLSGLLILAASLVLSACVASADNGTHWQLSTVDGKAPGWRATLDLGEAGRIAGQAPCNRFSGSLERSDEVFKPGDLAVTRMACPDLAAEAAFLALLAGIEQSAQTQDLLILTGGGHEMRFVPPTE